jgi:hypothetical protein
MYCFAIALPLMHGWSVIARVLLCHCSKIGSEHQAGFIAEKPNIACSLVCEAMLWH